MIPMNLKWKAVFCSLVTLWAITLAPPTAKADLAAVGAVDLATGFPTFFTDQAGVSLGPCDTVDPDGLGANNPPCSGLELLDPNGAFVAGNIAEFTYYRGEAGLSGPNGDRYLLRFEVQGGVAPPPLVANAVRVRLRGLTVPGIYTLTTPFGVFPFTATAEGDPPAIPDIDDVLPGGADGVGPGFAGTLPGNNQCFLSNGTGFVDATGNYFGDGITEAPLVLSVCPLPPGAALLFMVVRPDGVTLETNLFSVEGKIVSVVPPGGATPLSVQRASYSRTNPGFVDVFATSSPGAIVTVSGGPNLGGPHPMTGNANGQFFAHIPVADSSVLPANVTVTATAAPLLPSSVFEPLRDVVTITKAEYNVTNTTLTIEASSSDQAAPGPTLTAVGFGVLASALTVPGVLAPPAEVTVTSSAGGTDTRLVDVVSAPAPPLPPTGFSISGRVTTNIIGTPRPGVTMTLTGAASGSTTTLADGTYTFTGLTNGNYTITPSSPVARFRPTSRAVSINGADVTGQDFLSSR